MWKVDLSEVWDSAEKIARERHEQKKDYKSNTQFSDNYDIVGMLGEYVFGLVTGHPLDTRLLIAGDDGFDFPDINIKTSEERKAKHLIEFVDKSFDGWYVFVVVNLEHKYGYIKGSIHSSSFDQKSQIIDFGYGKRKAIHLDELTPYIPKRPIKLTPLPSILVA